MSKDVNQDDFGTEETVIPVEVLKVMDESGIGDGAESELKDTEIKDDDTGDEKDGSDDKGDTVDTDEGDKNTDNEEDGNGTGDSVDDSKTTGDTKDTEPIPQEQINIARRLGWSDEYIVDVASNSPEILEDMVTLAGRQIQQPQVETKVEPAPKEKQEVKGIDKVDLDAEALKKMKESYGDEVVEQVILPLTAGLNTTIDQLNILRDSVSGVEQTSRATQIRKNFDEANVMFDSLAETFEVFGKTENLPKLANGEYDVSSPVVKARGEVFKVANAFQASGMSWTASLKNAVRWYKGEHAEKSLERKIVKGLNNRKKKFSPRPTNKKAKQTFVSREDEGVQLIRKAYK